MPNQDENQATAPIDLAPDMAEEQEVAEAVFWDAFPGGLALEA